MSEAFNLAGIGHISDSGSARQDGVNQDAYRLPLRATSEQLKQKGWLFVVGDGLGAPQEATRASELAVTLIEQAYYHDRSSDLREHLRRAIESANKALFKKARGLLFSELSTSVVCAVVSGDQLHVAHVGDSRAYLISPHGIRRLTEDHVYFEESEPDEAPEQSTAQPKRLLTRALGSMPTLELDEQTHTLQPDERLLLCTQGLTNVVCDDEIQKIVAHRTPQSAAQQLVDLAKQRGSTEDITALVVEPWALNINGEIIPTTPPLFTAPKTVNTPSLMLTGVIGVIVFASVLIARSLNLGGSTSLAASLTTPGAQTSVVQVASTATATASPTAHPTDTPTASATPRPTSTDTPLPTATETETPTPEPVEDSPTPTRAPTRPRPTATQTTAPTPTSPPPVVQPRYPALKLREPQFNQEMTGNAVVLEFEVVTLLPGDSFEIYYKRTASQTWEGKCAPITGGKCTLTFDRVQGSGSYDWTAVVVDSTGFVVSRLRDVSRFIWNPIVKEPTPKPEPTEKPTPCIPQPLKRC